MSGSSAEDIRKHLKVYWMVFGALFVLTGVTVACAELHFLTVPMAIALALFVASIKGTLVACYFMHLVSEKSVIFGILAICALFFLVLMLLPTITIHDAVGVHL
jgi:cytochrome c oxidase subunit 4